MLIQCTTCGRLLNWPHQPPLPPCFRLAPKPAPVATQGLNGPHVAPEASWAVMEAAAMERLALLLEHPWLESEEAKDGRTTFI